ncbi:Cation/H(+) antiporter 17 Protein CATION/H+ EXCHANGER 17 [Vigna angularis]|uniref:Cation/H(+) antiporter 17 Protein CATION/H+ EXCHANGER 17 n=1 Tax=Phaseolus angularis TaxID=3914 RepID=A0A8T0KLJ1_PHAAN|nr:Cation/H(+) antiporter 17 Protein CATION/H+ EXCHANGER 17 [Vigna angularis]
MKLMPRPPVDHVCSTHFFEGYQNFDYDNFNSTLLQYNASVHKIIIFEHCPTIPNFPLKHKFTCADVVYYFEEGYTEKEMLHKYPLLNDCNRRLNVPTVGPLDRYDDTNDGAGVLEEALSDAFKVSDGGRDFTGEGIGGKVEKLEGVEYGDGGGMLPLRRWGRGDEVEAARWRGDEDSGEILLGPSTIERNEKFLNTIFPKKNLTVLETMTHLGLLFFLFLVGVALSITAFPVLARILAELKLLTIDVGRIVMVAAAVNDVGAWILLAIAIALSRLINS